MKVIEDELDDIMSRLTKFSESSETIPEIVNDIKEVKNMVQDLMISYVHRSSRIEGLKDVIIKLNPDFDFGPYYKAEFGDGVE